MGCCRLKAESARLIPPPYRGAARPSSEAREAVEILREATELRPEDERGWDQLAKAYEKIGNEEEAERCRQKYEALIKDG